jgi:hypothetical protein
VQHQIAIHQIDGVKPAAVIGASSRFQSWVLSARGAMQRSRE